MSASDIRTAGIILAVTCATLLISCVVKITIQHGFDLMHEDLRYTRSFINQSYAETVKASSTSVTPAKPVVQDSTLSFDMPFNVQSLPKRTKVTAYAGNDKYVLHYRNDGRILAAYKNGEAQVQQAWQPIHRLVNNLPIDRVDSELVFSD